MTKRWELVWEVGTRLCKHMHSHTRKLDFESQVLVSYVKLMHLHKLANLQLQRNGWFWKLSVTCTQRQQHTLWGSLDKCRAASCSQLGIEEPEGWVETNKGVVISSRLYKSPSTRPVEIYHTPYNSHVTVTCHVTSSDNRVMVTWQSCDSYESARMTIGIYQVSIKEQQVNDSING